MTNKVLEAGKHHYEMDAFKILLMHFFFVNGLNMDNEAEMSINIKLLVFI